ncbi:MAG: hypothetical protein IT372_26920, partial [Polyangiaceae bacterium]|nr:hypothetical protein [Polyangiaceae bacterium]
RAPFEGDSPVALLVQHTHAPPADLLSIARASYVPAPIAQVVMQSLSKKPAERPRDARALGRELSLAARAGGLDPDEIAAQASLGRGAAVVKLASKARTRALDLSPELAAQIRGIAAATPAREGARPGPGELPEGAAPRAITGDPRASEPRAPLASTPEGAAGAQPAHPGDAPPRPPHPSSPGSVRGPASARRRAELDFECDPLDGAPEPQRQSGGFAPAGAAAGEEDPEARISSGGPGWRAGRVEGDPEPPMSSRGAELAGPSTMHGVESSAHPRPRRARIARATAILACVAAAGLVVAVVGIRQTGGLGAAEPADSLEAQLDRARDCMRRHAWDAPPGENVKEITDRALARWPSDARVAELRREASERIVTDALGRKYAGDPASAIRLARLALELQPALTTAQHLVAELEGGSERAAPAVAPAASEAGAPGRPPPSRAAPQGALPPGPASARQAASAAPTAAPAASATSAPAPVLPPSPPPLPTGHAPPPPSSTGPWL